MITKKIVKTIIVLTILLIVTGFGVYVIVSKGSDIKNNISFEVVNGAMFETNITYNWSDKVIEFKTEKETGEPNKDDAISTGENSYQTVQTPPDIVFQDTETEYLSTYTIKNTGTKAITLKINGLAYDGMQKQKFITKVSYKDFQPIEVKSSMVAQDGLELDANTFSVTIVIEPEQTETILVSYRLASTTSSFSITESIGMSFIC